MKYSPYIELPLLPGKNFNPCVRIVMHSKPVENTDAFFSFQFGWHDRITDEQQENLLIAAVMGDALGQKVPIRQKDSSFKEVTLRHLIDKNYFVRDGQRNMFWIRKHPELGDHDYKYRTQSAASPAARVRYHLKRPQHGNNWRVAAIRSQKSEMLNLTDFQEVLMAKDGQFAEMSPTPHATHYAMSLFGLVGERQDLQNAEGRVFRGGLDPLCFLYIEPENNLLLLVDIGVSVQVVEGYKELRDGITYKSFLQECSYYEPRIAFPFVRNQELLVNEEDVVADDEKEQEEDQDSGENTSERIAANNNRATSH